MRNYKKELKEIAIYAFVVGVYVGVVIMYLWVRIYYKI